MRVTEWLKPVKLTQLAIMALAAGSVCGALTAFAAERTITQKDKQFSEDSVTIKTGDAIVFENDDEVVHNIMSITSGSEFNLGALQPGSKVSHVFSKPGEVTAICAIHPRMKLTVNVQD
jgi:plastocyanin